MSSNKPIDFVITWVDGNDPAWQKQRQQYITGSDQSDNRDVRYRDWDNLYYWFRSVEKYAPWVNKIHLITWGHLPGWLNTSHPKLHIVNHQDYIPDQYLPTFNSNTIELNIHRIEGLAEQFVLFNDDMFITAPVQPEDFFIDGRPTDTYALDAIYFGRDSVGPTNGNNIAVINDNFKMRSQLKENWTKWYSPKNGIKRVIRTCLLTPWPWFPGMYYIHTTTNLLKSTMEEVWQTEYDTLDATCRNTFRQPHLDVNQWLFKEWQLAKGISVARNCKDMRCFHVKESINGVIEAITTKKFKIICINDTGKTTEFETKAQQVRNAFQQVLSEKSSFEK